MLQAVPLDYYLILSGILFAIGAFGVLTRKNMIVMFMSIELMLNSVNLTLISFSKFMTDDLGQVFVLFVMAVAAAEAAIGLAILLSMFRLKKTVDVNELNILKW